MAESLSAIDNGLPLLVRQATSLEPILRAVAAAAGPEGRTCLIDTGGGVEPAATALAVVRALAGARGPHRTLSRVLREMLFEADRDLGDGTARLALLWGGLVAQGARSLASGVEPDRFADTVERLGARLSAALQDDVADTDRSRIARVASSAGAAPKVADAIAEMLAKGITTGAAEIVAAHETGIRLESGAGFLFEAVPVSDAFAPVDLDPAFVLVADERIEDFGPLVPLLEGFATRGKALVVVARDVTGPALQALVRNHRENRLRAIALRPPALGQAAADSLEDLALATGATLIADRHGTSLAGLRPGMLGRCAHCAIAGGLAIFREPAGDPDAIAQRRRLLLAEAERQKFLALDRERLQVRAARLQGTWARLHLGAGTERDTRTQVEATKRALASARSAAQGGALAGGGLGLVGCFDSLPMDRAELADPVAVSAAQAVAAGLSAVVRGLAQDRSTTPLPKATGFGDLHRALGLRKEIDPPVLDPLLLTRSILERAVSGATALFRSGGLIHD